ncbi:MAG: glycosyltransferase family 2 protein [Candidatus Omnitrophota bacterium]
MDKCDIIIPVWNQKEVTKECVDSILKHTDYPYRLILIDNGSEKDTEDYLASLKDVKGLDLLLIRNNKNLGFVKAVNQGMVASESPYLCIMNNDTIATEGWLNEMMDVMAIYPEIGLLNPSSNTSGQYPPENRSIDDYALILRGFKRQIQELYTCRGFCMILRRSVMDDLGVLDEAYHLGYFDDTDYCKRAQAKGYRTARAKASYVYHKENTTFKKLDNNSDLFKANEKIFFTRWGRSVRVAYFVDRPDRTGKIDALATDLARSGHQVMVFIKQGIDWPVRLDHFDIRRFDVNQYLFGALSIYKTLKRKKKKKLDILVTDNKALGAVLKAMKNLHGSDVFIDPDRDTLFEAIKEKSKDF